MRIQKEHSDFTIILNSTIQSIKDLDAIGLYLFLATLPEVENINLENLIKESNMSKHKFYKSFNILLEMGLLEKQVNTRKDDHEETVYCIKIKPNQ